MTQSMDIFIDKRMLKGSYLTGFRIKMKEPFIFCSNPKRTIIDRAKLAYALAEITNIISGIEFFEISPLIRVVINSSKIGTNPHSLFFIFAECVNGIVRQSVRIILVGHCYMSFFIFCQVIDIYTRFCSCPQFHI